MYGHSVRVGPDNGHSAAAGSHVWILRSWSLRRGAVAAVSPIPNFSPTAKLVFIKEFGAIGPGIILGL